VSRCIQCGEHAVILLTRARPKPARGEYQLCPGCARAIRADESTRTTDARMSK
jgi:hypothetical protein